MSKLTLEHEAYCLLFMHACKYPMKAVNGLLIGTVEDGAVRASKALPMFHSSLALAPMLEAALMLVSRGTATMAPVRAAHEAATAERGVARCRTLCRGVGGESSAVCVMHERTHPCVRPEQADELSKASGMQIVGYYPGRTLCVSCWK